jgi:hypothetical protein
VGADVPAKYSRDITNNPAMQSEYDIVGCIKRFASDPELSQKPLVVLPETFRSAEHAVPHLIMERRAKKNEKRDKWRKLAEECPLINTHTCGSLFETESGNHRAKHTGRPT